MECQVAASNPHLASLVLDDLGDIHLEIDVEFTALGDEITNSLGSLFAIRDAVDRWPEAWTKEPVVHVLADDGVVGSTFAEHEHAGGHFGVSEQGGSGHGVVPVPVDSLEGQNRREAIRADLLHGDAGSPCEGEPDQ